MDCRQVSHHRRWQLCTVLAFGLHRSFSRATLEDQLWTALASIFSRTLSTAQSRRGALRLLAGSTVGLLGWQGFGSTEAHDARKKSKKKSGQQKKRCLKKAKQHNATHPCAGQPVGAPCLPFAGAGATCSPGNSLSDVCCSSLCEGSTSAPGVCAIGENGNPCYADSDCNAYLGLKCLSYHCVNPAG
jgi:hypothetical protein